MLIFKEAHLLTVHLFAFKSSTTHGRCADKDYLADYLAAALLINSVWRFGGFGGGYFLLRPHVKGLGSWGVRRQLIPTMFRFVNFLFSLKALHGSRCRPELANLSGHFKLITSLPLTCRLCVGLNCTYWSLSLCKSRLALTVHSAMLLMCVSMLLMCVSSLLDLPFFLVVSSLSCLFIGI